MIQGVPEAVACGIAEEVMNLCIGASYNVPMECLLLDDTDEHIVEHLTFLETTDTAKLSCRDDVESQDVEAYLEDLRRKQDISSKAKAKAKTKVKAKTKSVMKKPALQHVEADEEAAVPIID
eukprot:9686900-Karenia_brevis.AAC.1